MIFMVQRKRNRNSIFSMREKLYRMRMEIQDLEEILEECDNNACTEDYEDSYQGRERGYRSRY